MRCGSWEGGGAGNQDYAIGLPDRQIPWIVDKAASGSWSIWATTRFSGVDANNGGKQFTGITHLGDTAFSHSNHISVRWEKMGATAVIENIWVAKVQITGKLTTQIINNGNVDPSDLVTDFLIDKTKPFYPNDIW